MRQLIGRRTIAASVALIAAASLAGCALHAPSKPDDVTLRVFAAASLSPVMDELARAYQGSHQGVTVAPISYDGSATLATQITEGAPVDVFASADLVHAQDVVDAGRADHVDPIATNTLVIAVPRGNPGGVQGIADLASVTTVLCAPAVPCGAAAAQLLAKNHVTVTAASEEQNVTAVREKVAAGEADAGLVYATDVLGDDELESIVPAHADEVVSTYGAVALADAPPQAQEFVDFVRSAAGQRILRDRGFGAADIP